MLARRCIGGMVGEVVWVGGRRGVFCFVVGVVWEAVVIVVGMVAFANGDVVVVVVGKVVLRLVGMFQHGGGSVVGSGRGFQ